jgi:demethylmenaquinone methyltransferase/2-methoxy-6-polyprenyl-1,4-benzoquinol methylase
MPSKTVTLACREPLPESAGELAISRFYDGIFCFYEAANSLLTFGFDRRWRREAAKTLKVLSPHASTALDVCAGTGDFSIALYKTYSGALKVTGSDLNRAMLSKARSKTDKIEFVEAEAKALPYAEGSFDLVTMSFAARNLNLDRARMLEALKELRRTLKEGGVFMNLETTRPENPVINSLFRTYVKTAIGFLNLISPKSKPSYTFLKNTILDFYGMEEFSALLLEAGFKTPSHKILFPGAVAVHTAIK